jgi:deoxyribodipyrimidine photo-lyase
VLRRDLRLSDHAALAQACARAQEVHLLFVFDRAILDPLQDRADRRVDFIWQCLRSIQEKLSGAASLLCVYGNAREVLPATAFALEVNVVMFNHDDEPQALERDAAIRKALEAAGIGCMDFKDQSIFERAEVLTQAGRPYTVFTPYRNAWTSRLERHPEAAAEHRVNLERLRTPSTAALERLRTVLAQQGARLWLGIPPSLGEIGFQSTDLDHFGVRAGHLGAAALLEDFARRIAAYDTARDYPARKGPSYLSVHLRFGTLSIRAALRLALANRLSGSGASVWLNELIWRDFYMQILHHYPHAASNAFKPEYDRIQWETGEQADRHFAAWCAGRTGYPLVDAAMRQLTYSGYMHNRLRMVTASFLCKDLGIDWRRGEAWFARKLIDFDLSANNGGWQWAASSGCDAQPYFRIFNPVSQSEKFDAQGEFIRRYVPEVAALSNRDIHAPWKQSAKRPSELRQTAPPQTARPQPEPQWTELQQASLFSERGVDYSLPSTTPYPLPIVVHEAARTRTLLRYQVVKTPREVSILPAGRER